MAGLYAQATALHLQRIARDYAAVQAQVEVLVADANDTARAILPASQSRLGDYYAALYAGARLFLESAHHYGAIAARELDRLDELVRGALLQVLDDQSARVAEQSPAKRFFEALSTLLALKRVYLEPRLGDQHGAPSPNAALIGFHETVAGAPVLYLKTEAALEPVRKYWEGAGEYFAVSPDSLRRQIDQADLLHRRGSSQVETLVYATFSRKNERVLALDSGAVWRKYGIALLPSSGEETEG